LDNIKIYHQENGKLKITVGTLEDKSTIPNVIKIKAIKYLGFLYFSYIPYSRVVNIFQELSIILNTNLPLNEAIEILLKNNYDKKIKDILLTIKISQENGRSVAKALEKYKKYIGILPILFFNLGFKNSSLKNSISALSTVLQENQRAKKKFIDALTYPFILIITFFISIIIIFNFVLPKFKHIFMQFGDNLPIATKYLLNTKDFFNDYLMLILCLVFFLYFNFKYFYIKYKKEFDKIFIIYIPLISSLYKNFILYRFFLVLDMLVKSNYQFQVALENTKLIVENNYIEYQIEQILNDIKNGITISKAFENTKLFSPIVIRLLYTAQQTNTINLVLSNIVNIYKQKLTKNIKHFSTSIGPAFIMLISGFILWLVFALMIPIWNLSKVLN
jgi:general secretion pathway protein F